MASTHTGHCLCAKLHIEARGEPVRVALCHCRMCARHTGAPFVHLAVFPEGEVTVSGETYGYESSPGVDRRGCRHCGAPVYIVAEKSREIEVYVGVLDNPQALAPHYEIYAANRPAWLPKLDGVATYPSSREK